MKESVIKQILLQQLEYDVRFLLICIYLYATICTQNICFCSVVNKQLIAVLLLYPAINLLDIFMSPFLYSTVGEGLKKNVKFGLFAEIRWGRGLRGVQEPNLLSGIFSLFKNDVIAAKHEKKY